MYDYLLLLASRSDITSRLEPDYSYKQILLFICPSEIPRDSYPIDLKASAKMVGIERGLSSEHYSQLFIIINWLSSLDLNRNFLIF